jgi:hypothetical protein
LGSHGHAESIPLSATNTFKPIHLYLQHLHLNDVGDIR